MQIPPTSPAAATATSRLAPDEAAPAVTGDFETFLKLLTTQMRNQDPLKPAESTEFVAQLASFSGVEQQVRANARLDGILAALSGGTSVGIGQWIGREVRAPAGAAFSGTPIEVGTTSDPGAEQAVLVVRNDFDQVAARRSIDPAAQAVTWDGTDDLGAVAAHGRYRFEVESYAGGDLIGRAPGSVFATVREVRLVDGVPQLVLDGGEAVPVEAVTGLR
jgi:flagellar basal-body rod modification protein FlgD